MTGQQLIRLTSHGSDREVVLLHTPPDLAEQMGTFEPARWSPDLRAYLLHHEQIKALFRFARFHDLHVVDERRRDDSAPRPLPVECASCGQPGRLTHPPTRCPSCGEPWRPVSPPGYSSIHHRTTRPCPSCHEPQSGRFPYCASCGGRMPSTPTANQHKAFRRPEAREHLGEPVPLADLVEEVAPPS